MFVVSQFWAAAAAGSLTLTVTLALTLLQRLDVVQHVSRLANLLTSL